MKTSCDIKAKQTLDDCDLEDQALCLASLKQLIRTFDFDIFDNNSQLLEQQSMNTEEGQVGGLKTAPVDEDMQSCQIFQRFCVLLLTIHGK